MNELQVFNFKSNEIRSLMIDNEPWFVGKDVACVLGYSNPHKAIRDHVDADDKTVNESFTVNGTKGILVNESGLYSLILSSKLPQAKEFKRWVTSEVLPQIRKTGSYGGEFEAKLKVAEILAKCKNAKSVEAVLALFEIKAPIIESAGKNKSVTEYLGDIEKWELTDFPTNKVYSDYKSFCGDNNLVALNLGEFSKEIRRQTGAIVKRHRVHGKLTGFYEFI